MSFYKLRVAWLPLAQLVLVAVLIIAGSQPATRQTSVHTAMKKPKQTSSASLPVVLPPPPPPRYTFPDGTQHIFPGQRLVALYGTPNAPVLGALGAQDSTAAVSRVKKLAAEYQPYSKEPILPTFEIIATVASAYPTDNHDYSREVSTDILQQWITTARNSGVYVVLDLRSGRQDFLTQAKQLEPLLAQPNVGLALDPEWRLEPHQVPLVQIGHVGIGEVNKTADWLAALTHAHHLPQKLFLLHQFRIDMLPGRQQLVTTHPELAYAIQMDGQGTQGQKQDTWHAILSDPPANIHFGWKNFYHKDATLLTPKQTMQLTPQPWYVSYQ